MSAKKRKKSDSASLQVKQNNRIVFNRVACSGFKVKFVLSDTVGEYLALAAKSRNTSPEMTLCALLPTVAACLGPNTVLRTSSLYDVPSNIYLIGIGIPSGGKSPAFLFGAKEPMQQLATKQNVSMLLEEFTKAGLVRTLSQLQGRGLISADEVHDTLSGMLKRSSGEMSGERQLLLSAWNGRGHSIVYGRKQDINCKKSSLCIGGFMQPDLWNSILKEMDVQDGLGDRFMYWMLPGVLHTKRTKDKAAEDMRAKYNLQTLDPVLLEIFEHHNSLTEDGKFMDGQNVYTLQAEAQKFLDAVYDSVVRKKKGGSGYYQSSSSEDEAEEDRAYTVETPTGATMKYWEHVARVSLSLHCLEEVMGQMLMSRPQILLTTLITVETVKKAKILVDHLVNQTWDYMESVDVCEEEMPARPVSPQTLVEGITKRLLEEPGPLVAFAKLYKTRLDGENPSANQVEEACKVAENLNLGTLSSVETTKGKRHMKFFFKNLPDLVDPTELGKFKVTAQVYRQQFFLPLPSNCTAGRSALEHHPHKAVLNSPICVEEDDSGRGEQPCTGRQATGTLVDLSHGQTRDEARELSSIPEPQPGCSTETGTG